MDYWNSKICTLGHVIDFGLNNLSPYCAKCGSTVLSECPHCTTSLRGASKLYGFYDIEEAELKNMEYPNYCYNCGKAFPWTESILKNAIELLSLDEHVSEGVKTIITDAIPDLLVSTPSSSLAVTRYKLNIGKFEQPIKDGMYQLLVDVVSESIKKVLFPDI